MRQLKYKLEFKKNGIYLAYRKEPMGRLPTRKSITIFRYLSGKMYKYPLRGEVLATCGSFSKETYVDWGTMTSEIVARDFYLWPEDKNTTIPWSENEVFELDEDEILTHVVTNSL